MENRSIGLGLLALLACLGVVYWLVAPRPKPWHGLEAAAPQTAVPAPANASGRSDGAKPAAADASSPASGKDATAAAAAPRAKPSFRDDRIAETPAEPAAATGDSGGGGTSFKDARTLDTTSFKDERLVETKPFRDERPAEQPSFHDERKIEVPSFRDERTSSQPSFRDERLSTGGEDDKQASSFRDDRMAAPAGERGTPSFRDDRLAAASPSKDGRPSFRDDRLVDNAPPAPREGEGTQIAAATMPRLNRADCPSPEISGEALDGGRMNVRAHAACQANQTVRIAYGGAELIRQLDGSGNLDFTLDCFAGAGSPVEIRFPDGTKKSMPAAAYELDKVSKIAVIWRTPVNLDLHVFEYAARFGQAGHVWAKAPASLGSARTQMRADHRGHGFLSSADSEDSPGDKIEVYTFLHDDEQTSGAIGLALDYETRGETPTGATCGDGALAEVDFLVVVLPRGGNPARQSGVLTRVDCGTKLSSDIRFSQTALPSLRIRK